ncbi:MAG TPA: DUF2007 domain-containing protein [Thermoanaerobaculia bacterium]|nr:DUF2007 domain-containing protein [Thermoanaerobaculia bacterium]
MDRIWRPKTDDEVVEAANNLFEYTEEAQRVIRAELQRRGLPEPSETAAIAEESDGSTRCVFVANGQTEANQIVAFLEAAEIKSVLRGESTTKTHGLTVDGLGRVEVVVAEADEAQARALLASADAGEFALGEDEEAELP